MHRNKLLNLLSANRKRGEFRAEASDAGNTIWLYDTIVSSKADAEWWGGVDAETFCQTLRGMSGDVSLRINCPGGDVFAARAMAQAIREHGGTVTAYVDGFAASAASFITSVADRTVMSDGSMLMIHKAWTIGMGNADDFAATGQLLGKIDGTIASTYEAAATRRGKKCSADEFIAMMAAETWLSGDDAIAFGLADEIADNGPKASSQWDFSAYANAPKDATCVTVTVEVEVEECDPAEETGETETVDPLADPMNKIEQDDRPNMAADMLLRPTA